MQIELDYPVKSKPRFGWDGKPVHSELNRIISSHRDKYVERLQNFRPYLADLACVGMEPSHDSRLPHWRNDFLPGLDAIVLYGMVAECRPKTFLEIGSGTSTKFAALAVRQRRLGTRLISIDPNPRTEIDSLCDEIVRQPFEDVASMVVDSLRPGDVVFLDGSHRCFMNSDATIFFTEVLPKLPAGIFIEIHDVFLPADYPAAWAERYYSEQYLLACWLLAGTKRFDIELPLWYITTDEHLKSVYADFWARPEVREAEGHGCSFWIKTT